VNRSSADAGILRLDARHGRLLAGLAGITPLALAAVDLKEGRATGDTRTVGL